VLCSKFNYLHQEPVFSGKKIGVQMGVQMTVQMDPHLDPFWTPYFLFQKIWALFNQWANCEEIMNSRSIANNMMAAAAVNWVYFLETWLKFPNNLTRLNVGCDETTGLYFMSGCIEIDYEVGELNWRHDVDKPTKRHTLRTTVFIIIFLILFLCFCVL